MGMSSSQARLLNLTARQHSIEYSAQRIQSQKLQLANESDRVYDDYLFALDQTKTMAKVLQNDGTIGDVELSADKIYNYNELGRQYALTTADGKTLISQSLHNNYQSTDSLSDFLNKYNLKTNYTQTVHHKDPNPAYETAEKKFEADHTAWEKQKENYEAGKKAYDEDHAKWLEEKAQWDKDYANWKAKDPRPVENDTTQIWWETEDYSLANDFHSAAASGGGTDGCYGAATRGDVGCYKHILSHLIDYNGSTASSKTYTTSTGSTTKLGYTGGYCDGNTLSNGKKSNDIFKEVSDQLNLGIKPKADGETCDVNASSSEYKKLISKWNPDGTLKTMKQWAIDLNYVASNTSISGYNANEFAGTLSIFQNSLEGSLIKKNQQKYEETLTKWENDEPPALRPKPTFNGTLGPEPKKEDYVGNLNPNIESDTTVNHTTFSDKNLAQWYINLWYKMEGENDVPKITEEVIHNDATGENVKIYSCDNKEKSKTNYTTNADWNTTENENYMVIPDDKLSDPNWLHNAIQEGFVIIQAYDKTEDAFHDTSVSVDSNLEEQKDPEKVKKAEAQYEADMDRINKKDTKYDKELAICENERNAIKEEIDSLKNVIKDNVDLTFKLFS